MIGKWGSILAWLFLILIFIIPPAAGGERVVERDACLLCHSGKSVPGRGEDKVGGPPVSVESLEDSVHRGARCTSCHLDARKEGHVSPLARVECGACHGEEEKNYKNSLHGIDAGKGEKDVPRCTTCHGDHHILGVKDPRSRTFSLRIVRICIKCHEDRKVEKKYHLPEAEFYKSFEESVHGRANKAGMNVSAVCPDCHGNHAILPADRPESRVNKLKIPGACGKCHPGIENIYEESVHGRGLRGGILDSPVCTDCHGEHTIAKITDPDSKVYVKNIPRTCGSCHESEAISSRYAIPKKRFSTYEDSFHGIALSFGMTTVANCASCHGFHLVLPSSDKRSPVNKSNIPRTCGKCHPKASNNYARGSIHAQVSREGNRGAWFVRLFYTGFIGILLFLFILHIGMDLKERGRKREEQGEKRE
jgi:hypothetical protein